MDLIKLLRDKGEENILLRHIFTTVILMLLLGMISNLGLVFGGYNLFFIAIVLWLVIGVISLKYINKVWVIAGVLLSWLYLNLLGFSLLLNLYTIPTVVFSLFIVFTMLGYLGVRYYEFKDIFNLYNKAVKFENKNKLHNLEKEIKKSSHVNKDMSLEDRYHQYQAQYIDKNTGETIISNNNKQSIIKEKNNKDEIYFKLNQEKEINDSVQKNNMSDSIKDRLKDVIPLEDDINKNNNVDEEYISIYDIETEDIYTTHNIDEDLTNSLNEDNEIIINPHEDKRRIKYVDKTNYPRERKLSDNVVYNENNNGKVRHRRRNRRKFD